MGTILKLISAAAEAVAQGVANADYYYPLLLEYLDNFMQAITKINWIKVMAKVYEWFSKIINALSDIDFGKISITHREIAYYIGYIGINIVACFVGVGEVAAITRISKLEPVLRTIIESVTTVIGKLPAAAKLTIETLLDVLKGYTALIAKGTMAVIDVINSIFEAVLKWILKVTGKIARAVYLLTLSSGKILACSILPIEDLILLFGKLISTKVSGNVSKLGLAILESEGRFYVKYTSQIIFEGDRLATERFIANTLEIEEGKAKILLDDLLEQLTARRNAMAKWAKKFDQSFFNHAKGEWGVTKVNVTIGNRNETWEYLLGMGGHISEGIGEHINILQITKPPGTTFEKLLDNEPFKAFIEVRYKGGDWLTKIQESSIFPKNWDMQRVQEEIALVYENTVAKGQGLDLNSVGKLFRKFKGRCSTGSFDILIEVDDLGNIMNAYPFL